MATKTKAPVSKKKQRLFVALVAEIGLRRAAELLRQLRQ